MPSLNSNEQNESIKQSAAVKWQYDVVNDLFELPFMDLMYKAQTIHREHFAHNEIQLSTLLSIKTGKCSEDCSYCSQSIRYETDLEDQPLMDVEEVLSQARKAKEQGATRFCMGAAWRSPKDRDIPQLQKMVSEVKSLGMETCLTAGMLSEQQAFSLRESGLDYYNHNLDTSPEFYGEIISTRTYQDRLDTLSYVRDAGMSVCSGGILGLGEQRKDRISMLMQLANLPVPPESVPVNMLVRVEGTPLADAIDLDPFEFVRTVACARIMMPDSVVRLSAGRETMNDEMHALCFMAGANSIFYGDELLTTNNSRTIRDNALFSRLGISRQSLS